MVKNKIQSMIEEGKSIDDIIISLVKTLNEAISFKLDNNVKSDNIELALSNLIREVNLISEQHSMGVHIEYTPQEDPQPSEEPLFPSLEGKLVEFFDDNKNDLTDEFEDFEEELEHEIRAVEMEERNGSKAVNERVHFLSGLNSVYDGFDIEGRPENATFALYVSTVIN